VFTVNFFQNGFILQLTPQDQAQLQEICMPVELKSGQILCGSPDDEDAQVYFLTGATVALLVEGEQQATVAVGLLGAEGVVGVSAVLNSTHEHLKFEVQTAGRAWCAPSSALRRLIDTRPPILWFISKYLWQLVEHIAQVSAEIQTHDIRRRLACWLLLSAHKAKTQTLHLTHEHLARMLSVRRVSITLAAGELRDAGLLTYSRGRLHIVDKQALEAMAQAR
jgi:CRP-like cAMP-binding protein